MKLPKKSLVGWGIEKKKELFGCSSVEFVPLPALAEMEPINDVVSDSCRIEEGPFHM